MAGSLPHKEQRREPGKRTNSLGDPPSVPFCSLAPFFFFFFSFSDTTHKITSLQLHSHKSRQEKTNITKKKKAKRQLPKLLENLSGNSEPSNVGQEIRFHAGLYQIISFLHLGSSWRLLGPQFSVPQQEMAQRVRIHLESQIIIPFQTHDRLVLFQAILQVLQRPPVLTDLGMLDHQPQQSIPLRAQKLAK